MSNHNYKYLKDALRETLASQYIYLKRRGSAALRTLLLQADMKKSCVPNKDYTISWEKNRCILKTSGKKKKLTKVKKDGAWKERRYTDGMEIINMFLDRIGLQYYLKKAWKATLTV